MNYIKTHIRIDTPTYRRNGPGWDEPAERTAFYKELATIFEELGFKLQGEKNDTLKRMAVTVERGLESLYLHPDDLSGWLAEGSLKHILDALKQAKTCKVRFVDTYETKVDCTVDEFEAMFAAHASVLRERLIEKLKTRDKRYAYPRSEVSIITNDLINPMDEVGDYQAKNTLKAEFNVARNRVIQPIIEQLIDEGIVCRVIGPAPKNTEFLRTRGKTEMAEWQRQQRKAAKASQGEPA